MKTARTADSKTPATPDDIPSLLREHLRAARRRNSRFSLRAFAKQVGIDHSTLSQVLRNKRRLSASAIEAIGKRMGMSEEAVRIYARGNRRKTKSGMAPGSVRSIALDLDTFQLLSVWHHSAILELLQIEGFKPDSRWIANALGITVEDVNIALQRLLRLGLLEMQEQNRWLDKSGDAEFQTTTLNETASDRIHQDIHELAIEAIHRIPGKHRTHHQLMFAVDSNAFAQWRKLVADFMKELRLMAAESDHKDDVYQVEVSFFPVTTLKQTKGEKNGQSRDALADPHQAAKETGRVL